MDVARRAREANVERYAGGDEIEGYLQDPYHAVRLSLAMSMLGRDWQRLNPGKSSPVVVDIGSAGGLACAQLAKQGMRPIAADADLEALRAARQHALGVVQLDATEALPFRSGSLDGILAGEIIEHLYDPDRFLSECCRVLRPSGVLVVTTPNLAAIQDRLAFLLGQSPRHVDCHHEYRRLHIRPFTKGSLSKAICLAGMVPLSTTANYVVWRTAGRRLSSRTLARVLPGLGAVLVISARPA
jgi:SAM-dependent methyltransferase